MLTDTLARFATETATDDVAEEALSAAGHALVDTLGCTLAGTLEPVSGVAARWVEEVGARARATVWGSGLATSAAEAAFANAIAAHALDFDDSHPNARGHASASLIPAALAAGEVAGRPGREVLAAYAIGLEVAGKLGRAFGHGHLEHGWHPTASIGALASTAVAARLAGHDAATLKRAWGVAGSMIAGLVRNFGTMTKPYHAGQAARTGLVASWMAGAGLTADEEILDGPGGVLDAYGANGEDIAALAGALGRPWEVVDPANYVKRWPCCYSNHRSIAGLYALIDEHGIEAGEVEEVEVAFLPGGDKALVSREPRTGLEGKFSIEYCMAAVLLDGPLTLSTFTDAQVMRPEAQALVGRVRRRHIPGDSFASGIVGYNDIKVTTARGTFETRVDRVPGSPAAPLSDADHAAKFTDCAGLALGAPAAARLLGLARGAGDLADISELIAATVPDQRRAASAG